MRRPLTGRVPRTRAGGEWTEAAFYGFLRSGLRQMSRRWPPVARLAMRAARRKYEGPNKRQKWEYLCAECGHWFMGKECHVDHIVPCGSLKSIDDVSGFVERLFCEPEGLRVLCEQCHEQRTNEFRESETLTQGVENHACYDAPRGTEN